MRTLAQGIGISCLSRRIVADLLVSGQLRTLASPLPPFNRRFFMITHRDKFVSPSLERFRRPVGSLPIRQARCAMV